MLPDVGFRNGFAARRSEARNIDGWQAYALMLRRKRFCNMVVLQIIGGFPIQLLDPPVIY
jgi:hypothetical protein